MTDLLCKKNNITYYIQTHNGEIHLNKQTINKSGFITYTEIQHNLTRHDIHLIKNKGQNKEYTLIKDITRDKLPLHILEQ